ncbi:MAG: class I SAM-dependent methyltransferase [Bdellovibrionota bacterium]
MSKTSDSADLFIHSTILASVADRPSLFEPTLLSRFLPAELANASEANLSREGPEAHRIVDEIVDAMKNADLETFRKFVSCAMKGIVPMAGVEEFYRTFDALDEILGLDYERDIGMKIDPQNSERLYEGAGVGVQSSYTTLITALDAIGPAKGARFIDLGSGYGRAGMVVGILRPDMEFFGYEYVDHRIEVSKASALRAGLSEQVHFFTQDLAALDFEIPDADVFYLFDPFTEETYIHVFEQLKRMGLRKEIVVAAKGGAAVWFEKTVRGSKAWLDPKVIDIGTLRLFRSVPEL